MTKRNTNKYTPARRVLALGLTASIACTALLAEASDHVDFPTDLQTTGEVGDPVSDITDLFAFTSPSTPGNLVLIMAVNPSASSLSRFSDQVDYSIRLRSAEAGDGRFDLGEEHKIVCTFDAEVEQKMTCSFDGAEEVVAYYGDEAGEQGYGKSGIRAFAGLRRDPFYLDVIGVQASMLPEGPMRDGFRQANGIEDLVTPLVMPLETPTNILAQKDVMSIVLEFSPAAVFGEESSVFAVVAETSKKTL